MFFKHVYIQLAFLFIRKVSTFNRFAIWLTIFKNASGERAFLFMQTASTFCQSAACFIVSKIVYVPGAGGFIRKTSRILRTFILSTVCCIDKTRSVVSGRR